MWQGSSGEPHLSLRQSNSTPVTPILTCKYVVNDKPVPMPCPECGWGIMVEKKVRGSLRWICPQKKCCHQMEQV